MDLLNNKDIKKHFSKKLLNWHLKKNTRKMPWKAIKDPYKIWLSEIILQQTRVDQGLSYYNRFILQYPDIHSLARADDKEVFKLWEGLGYYNRCRNLLETARYISTKRDGIFPAKYEAIRELKGIGPYTAAAISSFAFGLPYAVLDGNVYRLLSRIFGISIPTDTAKGKQYFSALADELLDKTESASYNQAIMDFGAVVCKPIPDCSSCIFRKYCKAYQENKQDLLPVKEKRNSVRKRWFSYFLFEYNDSLAIRQRTSKDIWQQLFEFPLIEHTSAMAGEVIKLAEQQGILERNSYGIINTSQPYRQQLSHQLITGQFITVRLSQKPGTKNDWLWVKKEEIKKYPFPGIINQYLQNS